MPPPPPGDEALEWEIMIKFPLPYFATTYTAGGQLTIRIPFDVGKEAAERALATMDARVRSVRRDGTFDHTVIQGEVVPERKMIGDVSESV